MDKYWPADAVAKDKSTSLWAQSSALTESKVQKDLLYTGSDDGVISVTEDGGGKLENDQDLPRRAGIYLCE
ncbi:MAG: hypothetical protein MZV63_27385 [Marinilabiliales bacterium]|nr:hypothetical protein [Marinilabiliales bacterium]